MEKTRKKTWKLVASSDIKVFGIDAAKGRVLPLVKEMVENSKAVRSSGAPVRSKFESIDSLCFRIYIERLLELMSDGDEKEEIQCIYDYWVSHEDEIIEDNQMLKRF